MRKANIFAAISTYLLVCLGTPAAADTITQHIFESGDINTTPITSSFAGFDASLGILTGVGFSYDIHVNSNILCLSNDPCIGDVFEDLTLDTSVGTIHQSSTTHLYVLAEDEFEFYSTNRPGFFQFTPQPQFLEPSFFEVTLEALMTAVEAEGSLYTGAVFDVNYDLTYEFSPVPVPAALWLFVAGLLGLIGVARRKVRV